MTASKSNQWKAGIKVLLGLGLLIGLTALVDYDRLVSSVKAADQRLLIAGLLLFSMQGVFESFRLKIVFAGYDIGFIDSVRLFLIGMFFGNFMPGMLGSDVYQVYHMHKVRPGLLRPFSLSLFLRLTGLFVNILLAVFSLFFGTKALMTGINVSLDNVALPGWVIWGILFVLLLTVVMMASVRGRSSLLSLYSKSYEALQDFFSTVRSFSIIQHASLGMLGALVVMSRAACFYMLVQAFGASIGGIDVVLVVTVTALSMLLPISFAGLGVREISASAILIAFGISPPQAVAISLVSRSFIWFLSLVGGAWFLFNRGPTRANV